MKLLAIAPVLCVPLMSCGLMCDTGIQPSIVVEVRHASADTSLAGAATGFIIDGSFSDSLHHSGGLLSMSGERAGTYTILITAPGFQNWSRAGVEVDGADCGTEQVTLVAQLVPVP